MCERSLIPSVWDNIYPKLVPLLETNRDYNNEKDRKRNLAKRQGLIHDWFSKIRSSSGYLAVATVSWTKDTEGDVSAYHRAREPSKAYIHKPFPTTAEVLRWPLVKEMIDDNTSVEEMENVFNKRRSEVDQALSDWRSKVVQDSSDIWSKGSTKPGAGGSEGADRVSMGSGLEGESSRQSLKGKERASSSHDAFCGTSMPRCTVQFTQPDGTTTENVDELSDDMHLLFRADTLFRSGWFAEFYPAFLPGHHNSYVATDDGVLPHYGEIWNPT